ncbi:LUD domain-containing protein [Halorarum halobium]|uniref:LUD domain-containing protein n=1 Tax=Halorarum halobium TaxID=3075121 RepID=UPI0028AB290D|nr:LUD domain-containing protein [Halobaculum sp. XH14]
MSTETLDSFRRNAEHHHATVHETAPEDVRSTVASLIDPPAVGVAAGYDLPAGIETNPTPTELSAANTGVTVASVAIADYGTLVLEDDAAGSEPASLFPERHVAILRTDDVVPSIADALGTLGPRLREGASAILATGPSATADMGELVLGAHGPEAVDVVLVGEDADAGETAGDGDEAGGEADR